MRIEKILFNLNIGLWFLMCLVYWNIGDNEYVNSGTIIINSCLIAFNLCILSYLKKRNNPLLLILTFIVTLFYVFRIVTLNFTEFSNVFERWNISHSEFNSAFLYLLFAIILLAIGLSRGKDAVCLADKSRADKYINKNRMKWLMIFVVASAFSSYGIPGLSSIFSLLTQVFLNIQLIALLCLVYIIITYKNLTTRDRLQFLAIFSIYILMFTLGGSRSAIVYVCIMIMIALLATISIIKIKLKWLILGGAIGLPVVCFFFLFATFIRQTNSIEMSVYDKAQLVANLGSEIDNSVSNKDEAVKFMLSPIFDRVGFYDFATEVIVKSDTYSATIDAGQLLKSIADNVLSPFFDVFDTPKLANSFLFTYRNLGTPSLKRFQREEVAYQSDQLTMFGEFFLLFGGWFSLIIYFPLGWLLKRFHIYLCNSSSVFSYFKSSLLLYLFYLWINSFGLDWLMFDVLSAVISYLFFVTVVKNRKNEKNITDIVRS